VVAVVEVEAAAGEDEGAEAVLGVLAGGVRGRDGMGRVTRAVAVVMMPPTDIVAIVTEGVPLILVAWGMKCDGCSIFMSTGQALRRVEKTT
jgi:hypothetical protein